MAIRALVLASTLFAAAIGAQAATLLSWGAANSVALGTTLLSFAARVEDDQFAPVAGLQYLFETDPGCGTFGGSASVAGVTDENGLAQAGSFTGTSLTLSCPTRVTVEGFPPPLDLSVHVFAPDSVVLTASPVEVQAEVGQLYRVHVQMTESGLPVNAFPLTVTITAGPSGATATLEDSLVSINSGMAAADFRANAKPGRYELVVGYGSRQVTVPVTQRVRLR
jgi:hypothetical protein